MFIHKIFHLHQPLEDARKRVTELGVFRELELDRASFIGDGVGHFEVKTRLGGRLSADIRLLPDSEPDRLLFQSVSGNVSLAGLVEFVQIRPNLTEVVLTVDYEVASPLQRAFDTLTSTLDGFLNQQLARLEVCLKQAPAMIPPAPRMARAQILARA